MCNFRVVEPTIVTSVYFICGLRVSVKFICRLYYHYTCCAAAIGQTLRRSAEGTTYIRQGSITLASAQILVELFIVYPVPVSRAQVTGRAEFST